MTLSDLAIIFTITTTVVGGAATGANYYAKTEFVTVGSLVERDLKRDLRQLNSEVLELEYDLDNGGLSDKQEWQLRRKRQEIDNLKQELSQ